MIHIRLQRAGYDPRGLHEARLHLEKQHDQKQRATISTTGPRNSKALKLLFGIPRTQPPSSSMQERRLTTGTQKPTLVQSSVIARGDTETLIKKSAEGQAWRVKSHDEGLEMVQPTKRKLRMHPRLRRFVRRAGGMGWAALLPTPTRIIRYGR